MVNVDGDPERPQVGGELHAGVSSFLAESRKEEVEAFGLDRVGLTLLEHEHEALKAAGKQESKEAIDLLWRFFELSKAVDAYELGAIHG